MDDSPAATHTLECCMLHLQLKKRKKKDQHTLKLRANGHNNFQHLVGSCNRLHVAKHATAF